MRVTKYEHAMQVVEKDGAALVIDPGAFSRPLDGLTGVAAVVITHQHPDHVEPQRLAALLAADPDAVVVAPRGVADALEGSPAAAAVRVVADGDELEVGPFRLRIAGAAHAVIHSSIPVVDNIGVLVDHLLFYPGDAFTVPGFRVDTLALPSAAPWMRLAEAMDYIAAIAPRRAFPVHDAVLSDAGRGVHWDRLRAATEQAGGEFVALAPGEHLDL